MNEIKLRAWDIKNKKLSLPFTFKNIKAYDGERRVIWFDAGNMDIEIGSDLGYGEQEENTMPDNYIFLLFTGLKDKNGKEIFVGDICKLDNWDFKTWEVTYDRGGFCMRHSVNDNYYPDGKYLEQGKIIGNIFENPELLNE